MNSKKIVIDAGHGGTDSGAVGNGITEKDYTLKISQYIADRLKQLGADVYMTRTTDETLSPIERTNRVLNAFGNNKDILVISNHINAGGGDGAEVIYALRVNNALPNLILNNLGEEGQNIRKAYQRRLPSNPSKDYYFMLRDTGNTEAMIVEYGFLDSKQDDVVQLKSNWQNYAEAVVRAIAEYTGLNYTNKNDSIDTYTVKPGDSLWSIAKIYGLTVNELKELNNLENNLLKIGQTLKLKNTDPNQGFYTVKPGDTLYKIAQDNNTTVNELMTLNNLMNNLLNVGQKLILPPSKMLENKYTVVKGDTLYNLADKFNTTVDELKRINNLQSNILSIGQQLNIPNTKKTQEYSVQKGDTLYSIAQKFNKTVQDIIKLNNLASDILSIGQIIKI